MKSYVLKIGDIRVHDKVDITEDLFEELRTSVMYIKASEQIEEKMDLLLDNYLDYEKEIISLSLSSMARSSFGHDHVQSARPNLNRKLVNILTAVKLYVDQTRHELSSCYMKDSSVFINWDTFRNEEHAKNRSYQFMEVLRNYVQHHSLPIESVGFRAVSDKNENPPQSKHTVVSKCHVETLLEFKDFGRKKNEGLVEYLYSISNSNGYFSLGYQINEYIDCISRLHYEFRKFTLGSVLNSESVIEKARSIATDKFEKRKLISLEAAEINQGGKIGQVLILNTKRMERRRKLSDKNIRTGMLSSSYVHSMQLENDA